MSASVMFAREAVPLIGGTITWGAGVSDNCQITFPAHSNRDFADWVTQPDRSSDDVLVVVSADGSPDTRISGVLNSVTVAKDTDLVSVVLFSAVKTLDS